MEKKSGGGESGGFSGEKRSESALISDHDKAAVDHFYQNLAELNDSSGLSLVFNFRHAILDLHCFYQEVIKRGGFYQVTKMGKWDDVASVSNSKSCVSMSAAQLQNVYKMLILEYELMYCCKMPDQSNIWPAQNSLGSCGSGVVSPSCLTGKQKRKHCESSYPFSTSLPAGPKKGNKNSTMVLSPNSTMAVDILDAPQKPRTGYHIFLRLETHRLRMTLGESSITKNLREMAVAAWRSLPDKDKLPYIEASKLDKERYERQMAAYKKTHENHKGKSQTLVSNTAPTMLNFSTSMQPDDAYRVSFEEHNENLHSPDESMVNLAVEAMKKAKSNESIFQTDLDNVSPKMPD